MVAPSSGRDVLKADPTGTGTAGLSRIECTVTNCGSWVGDSGVRRLQQLPLGGKGRAVLQAARACLRLRADLSTRSIPGRLGRLTIINVAPDCQI